MSSAEQGSQPRALAGRTAIVTGSGQNIGRAIALALAGAGAFVVVNGHRDRAAIEAVAAEARDIGPGALAIVADVSDPDAVSGMVERAAGEFGSVDIAVSNVSVRLHEPFLDISVESWRRVIESNLSSAFYLDRAVLPRMVERRWGRIIHLSGRDGFAPKANRAHNVTCKAGTFALAKAIAVEFGPHGITANAVAPGIVATSRDPHHYPDHDRAFEERRQALPLRRFGRTEDIAETCLFLCSEAGGYITGQVIHANGGEFMF